MTAHSWQLTSRTGTKGFITIKKGGDAAIYRVGQAEVTGWQDNDTVFQNSVGYKPGDTVGTATSGDLTAPRARRAALRVSESGSFSLNSIQSAPPRRGAFVFRENSSRSGRDNKPSSQRWEPLAPKARCSSVSLGHRPRNSDHHVKQALRARFNLVGGGTGAARESHFQRLWVSSFHKHWGVAPGWR